MPYSQVFRRVACRRLDFLLPAKVAVRAQPQINYAHRHLPRVHRQP